jgi:DNA gyrase inhibitor GyrI
MALAVTEAVAQAGPVSFWAVVQEFTGSFQEVNEFLAIFTKEFSSQKLDASLLSFDSKSVLILREDPSTTPKIRMAIGLTVPAILSVREPLKIERVQFGNAVCYTHVGPYEELGKVHGSIVEELQRAPRSSQRAEQRAGWPVILVLLNDPKLVQPDEIQTEVVVPVEEQAGSLGAHELGPIRKAVQDAQPVSYLLVAQAFDGAVTQLGDFLRTFMSEFSAQGLDESLPGPSVVPLAILHSDPASDKTTKIEIGFPVKEKPEVKEPLAVREFELKKAVVYTHYGDFSRLFQVHEEITRAVPRELTTRNGRKPETGWPVALRLCTDPSKVNSPAEIKTDIIVPIQS